MGKKSRRKIKAAKKQPQIISVKQGLAISPLLFRPLPTAQKLPESFETQCRNITKLANGSYQFNLETTEESEK